MKWALVAPASPPPAPLGADRAVGGVPGDPADDPQLPLRRVVGGDAPEGVLAPVPLPLNDLQGHGQVPMLVEGDVLAQEGEVDLPDLLKQLEGPENRGWAGPGRNLTPATRLDATSVKRGPGTW